MAAEATVEETVEEVPAEETPQERPAKKARGSWRDFFQRRTRKEPKEHVAQTEAERAGYFPAAAREDVKLQEEPEEVPDEALETAAEETLEERAAETPCIPRRRGEEMLQAGGDEEEDLEKGEVNPYTGHEYESNTVRMHPKRIGYVQVYDRSSHQWTDMTEWAFLGYQERKKALLGNDYEPPIYLDKERKRTVNWEQLLSPKRSRGSGQRHPGSSDLRSEFEKDYHRIIGSASFRRLQDKTQVFPLDRVIS